MPGNGKSEGDKRGGGGKKKGERERDENGARSIQPRTRIETREDEGRRMGGEKRRRIRRNKSGEEEREKGKKDGRRSAFIG